MASIANLVLNNGASTPVAKTFNPTQKFGGPSAPAIWRLKEGVTPSAWPRVEIYERATGQNTRRVEFKLAVPNVVLVDGVPVLTATCYFDSKSGGFIIPETAIAAQIADTYAFAKNLMAHAVMSAWVVDRDPAF